LKPNNYEAGKKNHILFYSGSGIGNVILQTPTINTLLANPLFKVDILFRRRAMSAVFRYDSRVNEILILPEDDKNHKAFLKSLHGKYDSIIVLFPSNRHNYHKFPFIIGAPRRIIHAYPNGRLKTHSYLSNIKIPIDETLHDVYQNLNLLKAFDIPLPQHPEVTFSTSEANRKYAEAFLDRMNLRNKNIVGIHPGCNKGQKYKRWPLEYYLQVADMLENINVTPLFFFGPDDISIKDEFLSREHSYSYVEEPDLNNVACIIRQCNLLLSSDSGLGHIAVAMGTKSFAITGPAQPSRTAPFQHIGSVIHAGLPCSPCLKYPFHSTNSSIKCIFSGEQQYKCMLDISPVRVMETIKSVI